MTHLLHARRHRQSVLQLLPDHKHAKALMATALHKTGKKKPAAGTRLAPTELELEGGGHGVSLVPQPTFSAPPAGMHTS